MSIKRRISKLEKRAGSQISGGLALFDAEGNVVDAEILEIPGLIKYGLARLTDGREIPVADQSDQNPVVMLRGVDHTKDEKLYWRRRDANVIKLITLIPRPPKGE
jgi:hypothetical protein